ncbi:MAG: hypothetical protein JWL73_2464 [Actinomycetia bacterium]|nr:hypothetical protein [Actinomycetes bacterium]
MSSSPRLPDARGPLTEALFDHLQGGSPRLPAPDPEADDPLIGDDFHLALHVAYDLAYRGFEGIDDGYEWDLDVLRFRRGLEDAFETALRAESRAQPSEVGHVDARATLTRIATEPVGPSLSTYVEEHATRMQLEEFLIHRSAYQRKEADPHTWGLPRLDGPAKAAFVEIQADEYGEGRPGEAHADLFAVTMSAFGLDPTYGAYVGALPGSTLATGNLISLFGLQRRLLPCLIGHLALFEMTSVGPMGRYVQAIRRLGGTGEAQRFYEVHVEADVRHAEIARDRLVGSYVDEHPEHAAEVVFGAESLSAVEGRFTAHLLATWTADQSSLRERILAGAA